MHPGIAKINVDQSWISPDQNPSEGVVLAPVNQRGLVPHILKVSSEQRVSWRRCQQLNIRKGKTISVLSIFRDDEGVEPVQTNKLPVDVQHLGFKKKSAEAGYEWFFGTESGTGHKKSAKLDR